MFISLFLFYIWATKPTYSYTDNLNLGVLYGNGDELCKAVVVTALDMVRQEKDILPYGFTLVPKMIEVPEYDSFQAGKKVCDLLKEGVVGVLGPRTGETWYHIQSVCDTMDIPHIGTRWDDTQRRGSCLVNLYPHPSVLSMAFAEIVIAWQWKRFTVIYDDNDGLKRINDLVKIADYKGYLVTVRQLEDPEGNDNFRPVLKRIKASGEKNFVLECSVEKLYNVLIQVQQVGLMSSDTNYIITSLDFQTIDIEPFKWSGTNITGVRLVDPENPKNIEITRKWSESLATKVSLEDTLNNEYDLEGDEEDNEENEIKLKEDIEETEVQDIIPSVEAALIHDAIFLFSKALYYLESTQELEVKLLDCEKHSSWQHGYSIINYMKMSEQDGMTGLIKFDHEGFRTDIELDIIEISEDGFIKKGVWNTTSGLNMNIEIPRNESIVEGEDLRNVTFIVLLALTHPYGMLKQASQKLSGNDRFEGFGIDLIHELSLMSGFNYTFQIQADKSSGNPDKNGKWNGMIGEVLANRADLAIADITITRERERDADFTMPFMNLGISILHRKPTKQPPSLFSFLSPFSYEVWGYMMSAYLGVSVLLFVMARISPYEWRNPYPCIEEPETLENQFSLANSLWFTMGSLMQQGSDLAPISVSTRMVAAIWWFFTLIMVSSYTANLAAFLTIEITVPAFRNVEELANQKAIKYGAKAGGSTANFFRDSNVTVYKKMWKFMEENPDVMMASNEAGVARVMNEPNYAFLMESTSIEYEIERKCNLTQIGALLDNKGYGIVMRKNSTYRNVLSTNVVSLQEKGKLTQLKDKWWREKRGGGACTKESEKSGEASELDLDNVGGVFLVMAVGLVFAVFLAIAEAFWAISTNEDKKSFKDELMEEIRFITRCHGTKKPVRKQKSESPEEDITQFDPYGFEDKEPLD